ncbi:MAG: hypothetical protein IPO88_04440 [Nannocystis sp.]|uniref:type ISP restriction/modification enzyme n=1 Tax=Nannocystis sp. TaxID=1962667 RepID=UPI002429F0B6|nr:type ISP restriction/modification enzyme [Nannocystis sp.]MBK9752750.1 hypothetical protein [Nannocystis sp.]
MGAPEEPLARVLAGLARGLRSSLRARLRRERAAGGGALLELRAEVTRVLVAQDEREFADGWAQTLVYLLLVARWLDSPGDPAELLAARVWRVDARLAGLLARMLQLAELGELRAAIAGLTLAGVTEQPVMHFYERFLAAYDPRARAAGGVFFTPAEIVDYLVATTDTVLRDRLGLALGLADATAWGEYAARRGVAVPTGIDPTCPFVQVVDPAAGTGTFVLAVIRRAHATMTARWQAEGIDAAGRRARWSSYARAAVLPRVRGVERMLASWAIAVLRLALLLEETGVEGALPGPVLLLGDTLAAGELLRGPISVVIGNPPYEREAPGAGGGGEIRGVAGEGPLADFIAPARAAGAGAHVKNLYNLYVYFWRWACREVFERRADAPGVVAMVTGASFLRGPGFAGMRAHLRGQASALYVLDLEGDRRGASVSDNVFGVSVPIAVTTMLRDGLSPGTGEVWLRRVPGSRADKLALCGATGGLCELGWEAVTGDAATPWVTVGGAAGGFGGWPRLVDLFPWQHSGAQWKRTWPIACEAGTLARRWQALVAGDARAELFRETRDRRVDGRYPPLRSPGMDLSEGPGEPIAVARAQPPVRAYAFRSFDRRVCLADARLGDFLRPSLWWVAGPRQVYLASLLTGALGPGPAASICVDPPDLHFFCGRGGKDIVPLWRDPQGERANVGAGVLAALGVRPEDLLAYVVALLSAPGYAARFAVELRAGGPRLPVTRDRLRFAATVALGRRAIAVQTFGRRWFGEGEAPAWEGAARCVQAPTRAPTAVEHADGALRLRDTAGVVGAFAPVSRAVWEHALSGYRPVQAWVAARLQGGAGRRSSRLDAIAEPWSAATTTGLLELLWVVEASLTLAPALDEALAAVCAGPCWGADELPLPTAAERREPRIGEHQQGQVVLSADPASGAGGGRADGRDGAT